MYKFYNHLPHEVYKCTSPKFFRYMYATQLVYKAMLQAHSFYKIHSYKFCLHKHRDPSLMGMEEV